MQFRNSNMSIEEYYRIHGTLTRDDIETLLDIAAAHEKYENIGTSLQEVANAFPDEDFLSGTYQKMIRVIKGMRKSELKTQLESIVAELEDIESRVYNSSEYGIDILKNLV